MSENNICHASNNLELIMDSQTVKIITKGRCQGDQTYSLPGKVLKKIIEIDSTHPGSMIEYYSTGMHYAINYSFIFYIVHMGRKKRMGARHLCARDWRGTMILDIGSGPEFDDDEWDAIVDWMSRFDMSMQEIEYKVTFNQPDF